MTISHDGHHCFWLAMGATRACGSWAGARRLELHPDGTVELSITAFSRPATWWSRLGSPVARLAQRRITETYLSALA
ncbi:DUF1990 family protein [Micrococcus terreus]|uniref:DUF1990 family protein n=1 Tax=Micrococcus terreus TaxID=574650 RepID=UPI0023F7085A|nr:DUF1990 family protein [Micrococcus terreus]